MSKLRKRLEEGKQSVPTLDIVKQASNAVFRAWEGALATAFELRVLRKTTKAYRGKELKKLETEAHKLVASLENVKNTLELDKIIAKEKFDKHIDSVIKKFK
jgi:hypothetical protein